MTLEGMMPSAILPAMLALGAATLLLVLERSRALARPGLEPVESSPSRSRRASRPQLLSRGWLAGIGALVPLVVLIPLAAAVVGVGGGGLETPALAVGLVIAMLARTREDLLHSECAIKLLWVMGAALALSWAGLELLVLATGSRAPNEQWAVLALGLDPSFLWSTALSLSLLVGLVLLGGAPFHFWAADLFQGVRPWLAPLAVASLQVCGARWLLTRLEGIDTFHEGARAVSSLLDFAALVALIAGGATLIAQRRPERRVGTLASLNGALILVWLDTRRGVPAVIGLDHLSTWAAHLVLALSGAGTLARFVPVSSPGVSPGPVLFRRHPVSAALGLYSLFSLAGVPGTPGSLLWLDAARALAATGRSWILIALAAAWLAAFSAAARQFREAFGVRVDAAPPPEPVPWQARVAMGAASVGIVAIGLQSLFGS
jgi:NADH:ubiquinone oxidoreductase subunit 2 (subunit N)